MPSQGDALFIIAQMAAVIYANRAGNPSITESISLAQQIFSATESAIKTVRST